ncbi:MAG: glycerol-3-phosphate 1-O-acyltransferase PlsY [Kiritimatiellae bacterium]|nr:glycerol-3-phosphate 1-O-acyltransferase PlsY [Kiritimatiellia bacterium]
MNANDARLVWIVGTVLAGYLMGSVPFGLLIAKARGVDLRNSGSGNIGATNVFRCVGKGWGVLALLLDALKGFLPAFFFPALAARGLHGAVPSWLGVACGLAAVVGHNWPVWLGFKGGKGVATSAGMALGVAPGAVGIGLAAFALVVVATRWVSLASMLGCLAATAAGWWLYAGGDRAWLVWVLGAMTLLVVWRHRANIGRLLKGTEPKIVGGKK